MKITKECINKDRTPLSKEQFIERIKTDDDFSKKWGELGPIYGKQWRSWERRTTREEKIVNPGVYVEQIDQIANLINDLKTTPDSRRIMVTAWNPADVDAMTLPPCHYGFQFYTRPFTDEEKLTILINVGLDHMTKEAQEEFWQRGDVPKRAISLMFNMRSVDIPLGLPFNIASYALLLEIVAKEVGMVPDELICNLGDCHIYRDQIEGAQEQVTREPYQLPKIQFLDEFHYLFDDLDIPFSDKLDRLREDMFRVKDYQHHSKINYPLSN